MNIFNYKVSTVCSTYLFISFIMIRDVLLTQIVHDGLAHVADSLGGGAGAGQVAARREGGQGHQQREQHWSWVSSAGDRGHRALGLAHEDTRLLSALRVLTYTNGPVDRVNKRTTYNLGKAKVALTISA